MQACCHKLQRRNAEEPHKFKSRHSISSLPEEVERLEQSDPEEVVSQVADKVEETHSSVPSALGDEGGEPQKKAVSQNAEKIEDESDSHHNSTESSVCNE